MLRNLNIFSMSDKRCAVAKSLGCISVALIAVLLSGCVAPPVAPMPVTDAASTALARLIVEVDDAQSHSATADAKPKPAVMSGNRITVKSYIGEAANLLSRIARARGFTFVVTGPEPRLPLLVTVDVENVSFEDFLTHVGLQFGQRADVVLGESRIEIRYRGSN